MKRTHHRWMLFGLALLLTALQSIGDAATLTVNPKEKPTLNRFASITAALTQLHVGDTLLIAEGVYREAIDLREIDLKPTPSSAPTRIAAVAGAHPTIMGSDVITGWERIDDHVYAKRNWSVNTQQVFINAVALKQIGGVIFNDFPLNPKHPLAALHQSQGGIWPARINGAREELVDDSFYFDAAAKVLYIKTAKDIARDQIVEVSTRPYLVIGTGVDNIEISGLKFAHSNTTSVSQSGAISLTGNHLVLDAIDVEYADGAGIDITGNDNTVTHSSANYCGTVGMKVRGNNARVIDNDTSFNNTRGFNKWWEAGGAKFVGAGGLQHSEVSGHRAYANNGDGIWFDWHNDDNRIHHNTIAYNNGMGIHYEASSHALIYDNYVFGNKQRGIYLPNSSSSTVAHNLVVANGMEGIVIVDERGAAQSGKADLVPSDNRVVANIIAWNGKAELVLPQASIDNRSDANMFIAADAPTFSLGWPSRAEPAARNLDAWRARSGHDQHSSWQQAMPPTEMKKPPTVPPINSQRSRSATAAEVIAQWQLLLQAANSLHVPELDWMDAQLARPGSVPGPALERSP